MEWVTPHVRESIPRYTVYVRVQLVSAADVKKKDRKNKRPVKPSQFRLDEGSRRTLYAPRGNGLEVTGGTVKSGSLVRLAQG